MPLKLCYYVTLGHTSAPIRISSFPYSQLQMETWPEVDVMRLREVILIEGIILNAFHSLLISETFPLFHFHFLVPVLQIYMYLVLLTWIVFLIQYLRHLYFV